MASARRTRRVNWAKFRVTAVFLAGLFILGTLVYLLTGGTLLQEKVTIYMYVPDATGLLPGSPVRVDGIGVGKVAKVALSGSNDASRIVKVAMAIIRDRLPSITADSYAELASDSLIGDKYVDITSGKNPAHIQAGHELTFKDQTDLVKSIDLTEFEQQLRSIDATLADIEQGRSRVGQFVLTSDLYNSTRNTIAGLEHDLRAAVSTGNAVGQALYTDTLYRNLRGLIVNFDKGLAQMQSGQGPAGQFLRNPAQYEQWRSYATSLRKSIADLRTSDYMRSGQQYTGWSRTIASFIQRVDQANANPMFSSSEMYDNLSGFTREFQTTLKTFREDPRKYLRLKLF
jgi:phospholipid/cholesterol/gamma-HCH transport system substrate-binding protein